MRDATRYYAIVELGQCPSASSVLRPGKGTESNVFYIAADHSDEQLHGSMQYVRVTTHRKQAERR